MVKNLTSIIILSFNTVQLTKMCLESIREHTREDYELIVVDNASQDGSVEYLRAQADVRLIENSENVGFPKGCNQGLALAEGDSLLLLNSDTVVTENWLTNMKKALFSAPEVGAVSCLTNMASNGQQIAVEYGMDMSAMQIFARSFNCSNPDKWEKRPHLVGFCYLFKREVYEKIGGLDECFGKGNCEDNDYSLRILMQGYDLLLLKDTFIHHWGSASFSVAEAAGEPSWTEHLKRNMKIFFEKWQLPIDYLTMPPEKVRQLLTEEVAHEERGDKDYQYQISVIIPVYNTEKYVCQCVDSILKQTVKDIEVILIDDASTDGSYEKIKTNYGNLPQVSIIKNDVNKGQGESRNIGIKLARGKYIYFMDSDDYIFPHGLENLYLTAEKHQADMVHGSEWYESLEEELDFGAQETLVNYRSDDDFKPFIYKMENDKRSRIERAFVYRNCLVAVWLNLYRRSFLIEEGIYFPTMMHEDSPFAFACYAATERIWCLPGVFYIYRQHKQSLTHDISYERLTKSVEAIVLGVRSLQDMAAKFLVPMDEELMARVYLSFFKHVWPVICGFYRKDSFVIEEKINYAVNEAVHSLFPHDASYVSLLLHFAAATTRRLDAMNNKG